MGLHRVAEKTRRFVHLNAPCPGATVRLKLGVTAFVHVTMVLGHMLD